MSRKGSKALMLNDPKRVAARYPVRPFVQAQDLRRVLNRHRVANEDVLLTGMPVEKARHVKVEVVAATETLVTPDCTLTCRAAAQTDDLPKAAASARLSAFNSYNNHRPPRQALRTAPYRRQATYLSAYSSPNQHTHRGYVVADHGGENAARRSARRCSVCAVQAGIAGYACAAIAQVDRDRVC